GYLMGGDNGAGQPPGIGDSTKTDDPARPEVPPPPAPVAAAQEMVFPFESGKVPLTGLNVKLKAGDLPVRSRKALVLDLEIANNRGEPIKTSLAHEWHGGLWPPTSLSASVKPMKAKETAAFVPVYLAGEDPDVPRAITLEPGKTIDLAPRMDWPGTGSVPAA